jgi:transcriptional regulator with XRE-family HTH domain
MLMLLRRLIGSALRRARLRQGRTLREVAHTARVSMPYLSEVERGRKEVSSEILAAICLALGLQLGDLLDEIRADLPLLPARPAPATPVAPRTPAQPPVAPAPGQPVASVASRTCAPGGHPRRYLRSRPGSRVRRLIAHARPPGVPLDEDTVPTLVGGLPGQRLAYLALATPAPTAFTVTAGQRTGW